MNNFAKTVSDAPLGKTYIFSVGQAGYIIKSSSGQLLGVDLYLSDCVQRVENSIGFKRLLPKLLDPDELLFDVVIATHFHRDHFDIDSIPAIMSNGKTVLCAAYDCQEDVNKLNISKNQVIYVKPGFSCKTGDFYLDFVDCDHGLGAPEAVGVIISVDDKKIYIAGDTCLRMDRIPILKEYGDFDVVIGPINGEFGNMNENEFAMFSHELGGLLIPSHYGMFASHKGNIGKYYDLMKSCYPDDNFLIMTQGECCTLD